MLLVVGVEVLLLLLLRKGVLLSHAVDVIISDFIQGFRKFPYFLTDFLGQFRHCIIFKKGLLVINLQNRLQLFAKILTLLFDQIEFLLQINRIY